ncbi:MAG: helix-turn-helix domain-containing protein [Candidatus Gastranaerophilales bacterium]|nr:helix-turn-helix domain-containing protein [Candidatus Gastranaerophilales bacterium]
MPEYLSKEEVKQWRSSLEKITLEEYAARLGKVIEEEKRTNDIVDIVLKGNTVMSKADDSSMIRSEKITSIAKKTFEREKEIAQASFSASIKDKKNKTDNKSKATEDAELVLNRSLTDREQLVFDYFAKNRNKIVYAKDLAKLLELPRDYVYKYIKNLRSKIDGDKLQNADNGGYILNV